MDSPEPDFMLLIQKPVYTMPEHLQESGPFTSCSRRKSDRNSYRQQRFSPYNRRTDTIKEDIRNEKKTVQVLLGAALIAAMCLGAPTAAFAGETTTKEETAEKTK